MKTTRIGDVEFTLAEPVTKPVQWIGQSELLDQVHACWTLVDVDDLPLCPRLVGKPGMGKTTLAQAAGQAMGKEVYIVQCTMDTRPEDLLVTPVLAENGRISYHASPLVSAMISGGVAILDEANRMSEKSWASLAPLLDTRRYVDSIITGARIEAHPDFRCCVTMNDDASTYEIPEYIVSRLQPMIELEYPTRDDELQILRYNVSFAPEDLLDLTVNFLQKAQEVELGYTTRDGVNIMRYALKLSRGALDLPLEDAFHRSVEQILGDDAENFEKRARGPFFPGNTVDLSQFFTQIDPDDED